MHDETFLVTQGTVRFHVPEAKGLEPKEVDAKAGDLVVVPIRAPHTFSNPGDEEARFINTFSSVSLILFFLILPFFVSIIFFGRQSFD